MNILKYAIFAVSGTALLTFASCSPDVEIKPLPFEVEMTWNGEQVPQNLVLNAVGSRFTNDYYWNRMELYFYNNYGDGYNNPASITTAQPEWMQFLPSDFESDVPLLVFANDNYTINGSSQYGDRKELMFAPNTTNARREGNVKIEYNCLGESKTFEVNFTQEPSAHVDEPVSFTIEHDSDYNSTYAKIVYPTNVSGQPNAVFLVPVKVRDNSYYEQYTAINPDVRMIIARNYMLQRGPGACLFTDELPRVDSNGHIIFNQQDSGQYKDTEEGAVYYASLYNYSNLGDFTEFVVYTMSYDNNGEPAGFSAKTFTVK